MRVISIDLGASSGRCMMMKLTEGNKLEIEELHRFDNGIYHQDNHDCWDLDTLWQEVLTGIEKSFKRYNDIVSIGVDSWAVDFVCLDKEDNEIRPFVSYRDSRTQGCLSQFCEQYGIQPQDIFTTTAAQLLEINSLYQLFALKKNNPELFERINQILMIPDWFHFKLTGLKSTEFTNASTTQMLEAKTKNWCPQICVYLGLKASQLPQIYQAADCLGELKKDICETLGIQQKVTVTLPATHDTASAVVSVPSEEKNPYFISLGTWAVVGRENNYFDVNPQNIKLKIGNEGGVFNTYRRTKNVIGLWLIQNVRKELCPDMSYGDIVKEAINYPMGESLVFPNDNLFLNPQLMHEAIIEFCQRTEQSTPQTIGAFARCIFDSLACSLADTLDEIAQKQSLEKVYVIGGGAQNHFLCQSLADILGVEVSVGPYEATAIGNGVMQLIGQGVIADIIQARKIIKESFDCLSFKPQNNLQGLRQQYHYIVEKI
ncbi:MAG: rhamnulokinase [Alphaproteobacteria bacterium]